MAGDAPFPTLYEVPYLRLFPWLRLFRAPGGAADPKRLILAAAGLLLLKAGWDGLDRFFPGSVAPSVLPGWPAGPPWDAGNTGGVTDNVRRLAEPFALITAPFRVLFDPATDGSKFVHAALAALWATLVWGLIGGAIARSAVVAFARGERVSWGQIFTFVKTKAPPLVATPLLPFVGVAMVSASLAAFGLLYRLGTVGQVAAGVLAFLPLIGGILLTLIVVLLGAGWPLMHASVAAEAEDSYDAMSRSYAYVHQRPWQLAGLIVLALAIGAIGFMFVDLFARLVVHLTAWALSFGAPAATVTAYYGWNSADLPPAAASAHGFWLSVVGLLVRGWIYSYFWTVFSCIYLLLRHDVDGTPLHAIAYESPLNLIAQAAAGAPPEVFTVTVKGPIVVAKPGPASGVPAPHAAVPGDAGEVPDS
jgi:hypothetical protein